MQGVTFDTGALIGLERRTERMKAVLVYTSDLPDLQILADAFPDVRILGT